MAWLQEIPVDDHAAQAAFRAELRAAYRDPSSYDIDWQEFWNDPDFPEDEVERYILLTRAEVTSIYLAADDNMLCGSLQAGRLTACHMSGA